MHLVLKDQRKSDDFALAALRPDNTPKSIKIRFVAPKPRDDDEKSELDAR